LRATWTFFRATWTFFRATWTFFRATRAFLRATWTFFRATWALFRATWTLLRATWTLLRATWTFFRATWAFFRVTYLPLHTVSRHAEKGIPMMVSLFLISISLSRIVSIISSQESVFMPNYMMLFFPTLITSLIRIIVPIHTQFFLNSTSCTSINRNFSDDT
jgi:hypothetical protein